MGLFSSIPIVGDIIDTVADSGIIDNVPVLGTAAKLVSGINSRQEQRDATNRAYEFNAEEAQKQRDWGEGMWNKNNLYNSPANQLKLMKEAGLNPNTYQTSVSGASMPSGGASASAPSSVPQTSSQAGLASALGSAQVRLANAEAQKAETDADRTRKLLPGEIAIQGMTLSTGSASVRLTDAQIAELQSKMKVDESSIRQMDAQTQNLAKQYDLMLLDEKQKKAFTAIFEEKLRLELLQMKANLHLTDAQINSLASQVALNSSQIELNGDLHLLNGIRLDYEDDTLQLNYLMQKDEYSMSVLNNRSKKRISKFRANRSDWLHRFCNAGLDTFEMLTTPINSAFDTSLKTFSKTIK